MKKVTPSVRVLGPLLILAIVLFGIEISSYVLIEHVVHQKASYLLFKSPEFNEKEVNNYLNVRNPHLGWPGKDAINSDRYDASGSRPVPAFPSPGNECITLYGDSFTYGKDVQDQETWGNILSRRNHCRVGNFGVTGYGTDQSFLRFQQNTGDTAPISILGIYPTDIIRNVNQYRYLLTSRTESIFGFKPRFIIENEQLRLAPLPMLSYPELRSLAKILPEILPFEIFLPGNGVGPVPNNRFPYSLVAWNLFLNERVQSWALRKPSWEDLIQQDHASGALEVTVAVVQGFMEECREREKNCFIITFPTPGSYKNYKNNGVSSLEPLLKKLNELKTPYLRFETYLSEQLGEDSICKLLTNIRRCTGHFNAKGHNMIADFVSDYLAENRML